MMKMMVGLLKRLALLVPLLAVFYGAIYNSGPFDPLLCSLTGRTYFCPNHTVSGFVASPDWNGVKEVFATQFKEGRNLDGQLYIWKDGKPVVDLYGSNDANRKGYDEESLQVIFSSTKVLTSVVIAKLVDEGILDYEKPVAHYWPEFAQNGKENITLKDVLRHEGGLEVFATPIPWAVFTKIGPKNDELKKLIESSAPKWPEAPRSRRSYHATTRGLILNELVKQVDRKGRSVGKLFDEELRQPLNLNCYIGAPDSVIANIVPLIAAPRYYDVVHLYIPYLTRTMEKTQLRLIDTFLAKDSWFQTRGHATVGRDGADMKLDQITDPQIYPEAIKSESPSTNGVCNARSLGTVLAMLANGGEINGTRILKQETINKMIKLTEPATFVDNIIPMNFTFTDGGVAHNMLLPLLGGGWYGWAGLGGSLAQFNPTTKMAYAYTCTGMNMMFSDPRTQQVLSEMKKMPIFNAEKQ